MHISDTGFEYDMSSSSARQRRLKVKKKPRFVKLVDRISGEIGFGNNGRIKRIVYRYPVSACFYDHKDICGDDDIQFIHDNLNNIPHYDTVELFVDYEMHDDSNENLQTVLEDSQISLNPDEIDDVHDAEIGQSEDVIQTESAASDHTIRIDTQDEVEEAEDPVCHYIDGTVEVIDVDDSSDEQSIEDSDLLYDDNDSDEDGGDVDEDNEAVGTSERIDLNAVPNYTNSTTEEQDCEIQYADEYEGISTWDGVSELRRGLVFAGKKEVQAAVKMYSMKKNVTFRVTESYRHKLALKCKSQGDNCSWRLRAIYKKSISMWQITVLHGPHTCSNSRPSQDHCNLDGSLIAGLILEMVAKTPNLSLDLIIKHVKDKWGYTISRRKAFGAKRKAWEKIFGSWEESYNMLPRYLNALTHYNPGSITILLTDETNKTFKRVFWSFKPCIEGLVHCRPVIQIDRTFLYGKYPHTFFVATALDGNNHILPIGFAIVESENKSSWEWFMECIKLNVTHRSGLCIISNQHIDIVHTMNNEGSGWSDRFCLRHFVSNYNNDFHNIAIKKLLYQAGAQAQPRKFKKIMDNIKAIDERSFRWAMDKPVEKWSLSNDNGSRCGHMTTNIVECINGVLKGIRQMPIQSIVEHTFGKMASYFDSRRKKYSSLIAMGEKVTPKCKTMMEKYAQRANGHSVTKFSCENGLFEVRTSYDPIKLKGNNIQLVDLESRECSCRKFQNYRMPCSHAIAVCMHMHRNFWDFVDKVHTLDENLKVYNFPFQPLPHKDYWPETNSQVLFVNPMCKRKKGRPKSARIGNEMEETNSYTCSKCGQNGHNRTTCKNPGKNVNVTQQNMGSSSRVSNPPSSSRTRRRRIL